MKFYINIILTINLTKCHKEEFSRQRFLDRMDMSKKLKHDSGGNSKLQKTLMGLKEWNTQLSLEGG